MGGRGTGKTEASSHAFYEHVNGPPCVPHAPGGHWPSIVAPTLGDAVTSCIEGPSGLKKWNPDIKVVQRAGGTLCVFPNGVEAKLFGAYQPEDVERFRSGGNRCFVWCEEMAAWRYLEETWDQILFGLRSGPNPRFIASTTPKNRKTIREMVNNPNIHMTFGTTNDNPHLPVHIRQMLYDKYQGTRLGRQELGGELLLDTENALWQSAWIETHRRNAGNIPDHFDRMVIGIDPAAKSEDGSDETGIVVAGMVKDWEHQYPDINVQMPELSHGFVFDDRSGIYAPSEWAKMAVRLYYEYHADRIVPEINNGGEMVLYTIQTIDDTVRVKPVTATRGKTRRAEPVAQLYEQGRIHHIGEFPELEDQMLMWDPMDEDPSWSPDRMDALVWAITDMMVNEGIVRKSKTRDNRLRGRR